VLLGEETREVKLFHCIPLKRRRLSGVYPAIVWGRWFIGIDLITYAQYSYSPYWFGMTKRSNKTKKDKH
jgi:hypothetical protein